MLVFTNVKVSSFDLDEFVVTWTVDLKPATEDINNYRFFVQRSNSEEGPFDELNTAAPLTDTFTFTDKQINRLSKWRRFFYRIRAVDVSVIPNVEVISKPADLAIQSLTEQKRHELEMARLDRILLSGVGVVPGFVGVKCLVFKRRSFGQRCPECWDDLKRKVTMSRCLTCFGTGFRFGYHTPIVTHICFDVSTDKPELTPIGETQPNVLRAWTSNYPVLTGGDLIIDQENARWRVQMETRTEHLRIIIRQTISLFQLQPGDVEYQVPFNTALLD